MKKILILLCLFSYITQILLPIHHAHAGSSLFRKPVTQKNESCSTPPPLPPVGPPPLQAVAPPPLPPPLPEETSVPLSDQQIKKLIQQSSTTHLTDELKAERIPVYKRVYRSLTGFLFYLGSGFKKNPQSKKKKPYNKKNPALEQQVAVSAIQIKTLSFTERNAALINAGTPEAIEKLAAISTRILFEQQRIIDEFHKTTTLSVPQAQKKIKEYADAFLVLMQEAEELRAQDDATGLNKNEDEIQQKVDQAIHVYEQAIIQAHKVKWTRKSLNQYVLMILENPGHPVSPSTLAGWTAGLTAHTILSNPLLLVTVASTVTYIIAPASLLGVFACGAGTLTLTQMFSSKVFTGFLSAITGFLTKPIYQAYSVYHWKLKNNIPAIPPAWVLNSFWEQIQSYEYETPPNEKRHDQNYWIIEKMDKILKKPLCEALLMDKKQAKK